MLGCLKPPDGDTGAHSDIGAKRRRQPLQYGIQPTSIPGPMPSPTSGDFPSLGARLTSDWSLTLPRLRSTVLRTGRADRALLERESFVYEPSMRGARVTGTSQERPLTSADHLARSNNTPVVGGSVTARRSVGEDA